jgi:hypothetical protein
MAGLREAVQEQHGLSLAGDEIMQPHAVHLGVSALRGLSRGANRQPYNRRQHEEQTPGGPRKTAARF